VGGEAFVDGLTGSDTSSWHWRELAGAGRSLGAWELGRRCDGAGGAQGRGCEARPHPG
jgi:hypothetical protein